MNQRTSIRLPFQKECILYHRFGFIKTQTVDMSLMGLGVNTNGRLPFKIGHELIVFVPSLGNYFPKAKLMWTKKMDINYITRIGLKFSTIIIE
jgi:hypothetical protein